MKRTYNHFNINLKNDDDEIYANIQVNLKEKLMLSLDECKELTESLAGTFHSWFVNIAREEVRDECGK